jgi:hypothetical protein
VWNWLRRDRVGVFPARSETCLLVADSCCLTEVEVGLILSDWSLEFHCAPRKSVNREGSGTANLRRYLQSQRRNNLKIIFLRPLLLTAYQRLNHWKIVFCYFTLNS